MFQYLVKLLMGNSDSLFTGLLVALFGYYGWLLLNIGNTLKKILNTSEKQSKALKRLENKVAKLDEDLYRELDTKLKDSLVLLEKMDLQSDKREKNIDRYYNDIVQQVKDSSSVVKEVVQIMAEKNNLY